MPSIRQKRVAKLIVENLTLDKPLTGGEIVESSGYGASMKKNSHVVLKSDGVEEALKEMGFTEENAQKVVSEIMLNPDVEPNARLKATDQVFKIKGSYAPEKSVNLSLHIDKETEEVANEVISRYLNGGRTNT